MGVKIECIAKRNGGTTVEFPTWPSEAVPDLEAPEASYHFVPETSALNSPHTCVVDNAVHASRLLSIHGYRLVMDDNGLPRPGQTAGPAKTLPAPDTTEVSAPSNTAIAEIRALPIRDLKASINTFNVDNLRAALAEEIASADGRKGFIEVVQAHLGIETPA